MFWNIVKRLGLGMGNGNRVPGDDIIISQATTTTTHPPTPQLLTMKEDSDNKVPLVKMSQDDPLYPSSKKNYQVDSDNNNRGESNMIKEKVINNP